MKGGFNEVAYGYCRCGCNQKTKINTRNDPEKGWVKGEPRMFLNGHNLKPMYGKNNPMHNVHKYGKDSPGWKGGRKVLKCKNTSYVMVHMPKHPRGYSNGYVLEHILIVEEALGWPLPDKAVVHHIDGNGENNKLSNLMVFKSNAEHTSFHWKERSLKTCGYTDK